MKTFIISLLVLTFGLAQAQTLDRIYRQGTVTLRSDAAFASTYEQQRAAGRTFGSICVGDDGSIFASDRESYRICRFNSDGSFVREFGSEGNRPGQFLSRPTVRTVVDGRYVLASEANGRLTLYDMNGTFYKRIDLDYMPLDCVALDGGKVAVLGHVPYGGGKVRYMVSIIDIKTEHESIIWSQICQRRLSEDPSVVSINLGEHTILLSPPFSGSDHFIQATSRGHVVVGSNDSDTVRVYAPDGALLQEFSLGIDPLPITAKDRTEYMEGLRESLLKVRTDLGVLDSAADGSSGMHLEPQIVDSLVHGLVFPDHLPYYYNLLMDSEDNLLAAVYTRDEDDHTVRAFSIYPRPELVGQAVFSGDEYDISLSPRSKEIQFHEGALYGVLPSRGGGSPRLVKLIPQGN